MASDGGAGDGPPTGAAAPPSLSGFLLLFTLALVWGASFLMIKVAVADVPPLTMAAGRVLLGGLLLYAVARWRGHGLPVPGRAGWAREWGYLLAIGFLGNALPFFLIAWGESAIDSGMAALLMSVMPISTMVIVHLAHPDEPMTWRRLLAVGLGLAGIVILVGPEALKGLGGDLARQLAVAAAAVCYAATTVIARVIPPAPAAVRGAGASFAAALVVVPAAFVVEAPLALTPGPAAWVAWVVLSLSSSGVAVLIYFHLVQTRGANFTAMINFLIPVNGLFLGALVLGEPVTLQALMALAVILAGIALGGLPARR